MGFNDHFMLGLLVRLAIALAIHMIHGSTVLVEAQNNTSSFSYPSGFSSSDHFLMVDDAQFFADNSSFVLNSRAASLLNPSCGRLLYEDRVQMKGDAVASFQTAFTFSITADLDKHYDEHGDGLAFTFARDSTMGDESKGASLCLLKDANNGQPSNQLFAVEFDTFRNNQFNDSSNNHIGVNVNSMNSTRSYNLCGGTRIDCTYLINGGSFTAWIDYNSTTLKLDVFFANGSLADNVAKPREPLIETTRSLTDLLNDYMYVGFSASTGTFSEVHQIEAWQFVSSGLLEPPAGQPAPTSPNTSFRKVGIIAGVCAGVAAAALLLVGLIIARYRWRARFMKDKIFNLVDQNLVPRMFKYKELSRATKDFSRSELLGSGGFGAVYKGTLPSGALVAVKRMRHESKHGEEGFQAEAASLSQIRHRNLVQLRGWCQEEEELLLVYDYMCNGSLDEWLFQSSKLNNKGPLDRKKAEALPLQLRHSILSGVAAALSYLHEECKQCVLHRDIKSSNVLLDEDLNAYLGDFGLARLIDHQKMEKTTLMAGTLGYMAPEMPHTGKATKESDVYSFGVLMIEVMCGNRPLDIGAIERGEGTLVDRVWRAHEAGDLLSVADSRLGAFLSRDATPDSQGEIQLQELSSTLTTKDVHSDFDPAVVYTADAALEVKKMMAKVLHLGLLCCNPNPEDRPPMRLVSQLLQASEAMEMFLPPLPKCKPHAHYSWPGFSHVMELILSTSTSSSVVNVQEAGQRSSQTTPPYSGVLAGEHANKLSSFDTNTSSVLSSLSSNW